MTEGRMFVPNYLDWFVLLINTCSAREAIIEAKLRSVCGNHFFERLLHALDDCWL